MVALKWNVWSLSTRYDLGITWCPSTGVLVPAQNGVCLYLGYPICEYVHICSISPGVWCHFQTWAKQEVIGKQSSWLPKNRDRKCVDTETRCLQRARVQGRLTTPCSNSNLNWEIENKNGLFTLVPIEYHIMLKHPARAPSVNAALISFKFAIFSAMLQFLHVKISQ